MSEILYDSLVVLVVSLLVTFELLVLIMSKAAAPVVALQQRLAHEGFNERSTDYGTKAAPEDVRKVSAAIRAIVERLHHRHAALAEKIRSLPPMPEVRAVMEQSAAALRSLGKTRADEDLRNAGQQKLVGIRMPLFVFFLAEELSRSFFPIYAGELYTPIDGLSPRSS